jgi:membrane peptidoglycan carboxypeptidase
VSFGGMTGYMSGFVWIGHDNYKPLASGTSGGDAAAPLWAQIMAAAHEIKGITVDRDIIQKGPSELGLVKAEACGVSGMKPTAACRNDANGYQITYDYYLAGTEPRESCNMHRSVRLCTKSMKSPGPYCRTIKTFGSIYIPEGHPLRASTLSEIREYFRGASSDKYFASLGQCDVCGGGSGTPATSAIDDLESYQLRAEALMTRSNELIANAELTAKQKNSLQTATNRLRSAVDSGSLANIKKYGSQLQSLVNKAEGL